MTKLDMPSEVIMFFSGQIANFTGLEARETKEEKVMKSYFKYINSALAAVFLFGGSALATEEPNYEVVKKYENFELRQYDSYIVAEMEVKSGFDQAAYSAFQTLFEYIDGNNVKQESIPMTAPVNQQPSDGEGEKIPMTAPVNQVPVDGTASDSYMLSFVMPSYYTMETVPQPKDPRVQIREVPGKLMAVREYSGFWSERNYSKNEKTLFESLDREGIEATGTPVYARYNPPFTLWFERRNEVMIEVFPESVGDWDNNS
jgi:hypothetical protein